VAEILTLGCCGETSDVIVFVDVVLVTDELADPVSK